MCNVKVVHMIHKNVAKEVCSGNIKMMAFVKRIEGLFLHDNFSTSVWKIFLEDVSKIHLGIIDLHSALMQFFDKYFASSLFCCLSNSRVFFVLLVKRRVHVGT